MIWLIAFTCLLFLSCVCKHGKNTDVLQYYVCGRSAGNMTTSFSLLASCIGGSATIGMIGLAWQVGAPAFWWLGAGSAGLLFLGLFLARRVRSTRAKTMPEMLEKRVGGTFRLACAAIIFIAYVPIVAAQLSAQALLISSIGGIGQTEALLGGAVFLFAYTAAGGQHAVMRSDIWQFVILLAACCLMLFFCVWLPPGRAAIIHAPLELVNSDFPPVRLVYYLLILGGSFVVGPVLYGRLLSADSQAVAKKSCLLAAGGLFFIAIGITVIGIALRGILPPESFEAGFKAQDILGFFVERKLPAWASIPILLGLLSAVVSSADSCLFTAASIGANDICGKHSIGACRAAMAALAIAACLLAIHGQGILSLLLLANDIYVCGVVPPVFIALICGNRRLRPRLMLCAVLAGGSAGAVAAWMHNEYLSIAALGLSAGIGLLGIRQ